MSQPKPSLVVFGYAFAHRKTQDFLLELLAAGYRDVSVLAAPWVPLGRRDNEHYFPQTLRLAPPRLAREICEAFDLRYLEAAHDDLNRARALQQSAGARLGIIAGARILKQGVIDLFADGIVNFHPGKLPDTAGLDAFYYSLEKDIPLGITAHLIDSRIDAGMQLFFEETPIASADSIETVQHNNFQTQIQALRRFLGAMKNGELNPVAIDRPGRNMPLGPEQKRAALARFAEWRERRVRAQRGLELLSACKAGERAVAAKLLAENPALIEFRSPEGWTPLIVAAFHQHSHLVSFLLERGADPNAAGRNGTTPLMYGKTALLHSETPDWQLLAILIDGGADLRCVDRHGHDIFHYVAAAGDTRLLEWLQGRK
jgi:methionyl-tRNA formyltransferase